MTYEMPNLSQETIALPEYLQPSLEPVKRLHDTLLTELSDPEGVLLAAVSARIAASSPDVQLGLAPGLLTDPSRSGVNAARYMLQEGKLPDDANGDHDSILKLWAGKQEGVAPLRLPAGEGDKMMTLADRLGMRGDGPFIYSREQVSQVVIDEDTLIHGHGGANKANRERIKTALALVQQNPGHTRPIIFTGDFTRVLRPAEKQAVAEFAPDADTELELLLASALAEGFSSTQSAKVFPDGSVRYATLQHESIKAPLILLAPAPQLKSDGKPQTGVYNAYSALERNPTVAVGGRDKIVAITSTHYGPMALVNNLRASRDLVVGPSSFVVVGDNQAARTPQAHLIETGLTVSAMQELYEDPLYRRALVAGGDDPR